jgi:Subtilase family
VNSKGRRTGTLYHRARDPNNGDNHINLFQYQNAPPGVWKAMLRGIDVVDGRYHAWLERDPGCKTCQAQFLPDHSVRETTTGSICNGFLTISVGAYDGHNPARPLAPFSSSGPTRDGRVKPLVLAPGMRILAARSRPKSGPAPLLTRMSGTSMAAPHVTGTIALMFEAGGALDIVRLRQALFDAVAPANAEDPLDRDRIGYGFLDTARAVKLAHAFATGVLQSPATARKPARETDEFEIPAIEAVAVAPEMSPTEAMPEADAPQPEQEAAMSDMCCGDKCKNCEHCRNYPCETCQCCQPQHASEAGLEPAGASGADPSWRSSAEPRRPQEVAAYEPAGAAAYLHPVDAADQLLAAGEHDATRFLEQSLSQAGQIRRAAMCGACSTI